MGSPEAGRQILAKLRLSGSLLGLSLIVGVAFADPMADGNIPVDLCAGSHIKNKCRPAPVSAEGNMRASKIGGNKLEFRRKLALPDQTLGENDGVCDAHYQIEYLQMNDRVRVETQIANEGCGASSGEFALRVRTITEDGEPLTRTFANQWAREDAEDVKLTRFYPMENSRDLVWVRVKSNRATSCLCADEP